MTSDDSTTRPGSVLRARSTASARTSVAAASIFAIAQGVPESMGMGRAVPSSTARTTFRGRSLLTASAAAQSRAAVDGAEPSKPTTTPAKLVLIMSSSSGTRYFSGCAEVVGSATPTTTAFVHDRLLQPGVPLDEGQPLPRGAEAHGASGAHQGEGHEDHGVDEVVVHERVVLRGQGDGPHHDQHQRTRCGCDAHADTEDEG